MKLYATKSKKTKESKTQLEVLQSSKALKTERHLKVQYLNRSSRFSESRVPQLRINGNWLESAGFKIGSQVKIEVSVEKLVIRLVKAETNENSRA